MSELPAARPADTITTWSTYTLALEDVCTDANILLPRGAELEADFPERGTIRITVKDISERKA